jgi:hypothetical protein
MVAVLLFISFSALGKRWVHCKGNDQQEVVDVVTDYLQDPRDFVSLNLKMPPTSPTTMMMIMMIVFFVIGGMWSMAPRAASKCRNSSIVTLNSDPKSSNSIANSIASTSIARSPTVPKRKPKQQPVPRTQVPNQTVSYSKNYAPSPSVSPPRCGSGGHLLLFPQVVLVLLQALPTSPMVLRAAPLFVGFPGLGRFWVGKYIRNDS